MVTKSGRRSLDCTGLMRASCSLAGIQIPSVYPGKKNFSRVSSSKGFKYVGKGNKASAKPGDIVTKPSGSGRIRGHYMVVVGGKKQSSSAGTKVTTITTSKTTPISFDFPKQEYYVSAPVSSATAAKQINPLNKELIKDIKKIQKNYPEYKSTVTTSSIFNVTGLMDQYKKLLTFLQKKISKANELKDNYNYIHFYNNNKNSYPHLTTLQEGNYIYYTSSLGEKKWVDLYKDFYLKYKALEYYSLSVKNYKSIQLYIQNLYPELQVDYNKQLSSLYLEIQHFVQQNIDSFNYQDSLKELNNQISEIENNLNNINKELNKDHKKHIELNQQLDKYKKILDNILSMKNHFKQNNFSDEYTYWNKDIIQEPSLLNFWIEFLNSGELNKYQIKNIGRKAYSETNNSINSIYYKEIPQVIYYDNNNISKTKTGYIYLKINDINSLFKNSQQGLSAKNIIDQLLYKYSYCSRSLSLSVVPIYYLEPNTRILIYNEKTKVNNEYTVTKFSEQLSYNGALSIQAVEVVDKLY